MTTTSCASDDSCNSGTAMFLLTVIAMSPRHLFCNNLADRLHKHGLPQNTCSYWLQEDNPNPAQPFDKSANATGLSDAEKLSGSWWSAKVGIPCITAGLLAWTA